MRRHLFISRASHVQVLDADTGKQIADIPDTDGVHGFAFVQDLKLGLITNGHADTITAFKRPRPTAQEPHPRPQVLDGTFAVLLVQPKP